MIETLVSFLVFAICSVIITIILRQWNIRIVTYEDVQIAIRNHEMLEDINKTNSKISETITEINCNLDNLEKSLKQINKQLDTIRL